MSNNKTIDDALVTPVERSKVKNGGNTDHGLTNNHLNHKLHSQYSYSC